MNKRVGATEQIPWKNLHDIIEEIQAPVDDIILSYLKKNKIVAAIFLIDQLTSSTAGNHLTDLCRLGKIKDLGYKRVKLKNKTGFRNVHLFGVNNGRT